MSRLSPFHRSVVRDLAVAGVLVLLAVGGMQIAKALGWHPLDEGSYLGVAILTGVAGMGGRRVPRTTLVIVAGVVAWPLWSFPVVGVRVIPLVVAGFLAALEGVRARSVIPVYTGGVLLALVSETTFLMVSTGDVRIAPMALRGDNLGNALIALVAGVLLVLGFMARRLQIAARDLRQRNEELVALRREEGERIALQTRTAVARDVHDIVAHHMTAIVVTAQSAAADRHPDASTLRATVETIAVEGREALAAMRRAVRILRGDDAGESDDRMTDVLPAIDAMAERVRATGRTVTVHGTPGPIPQFTHAAIAHITQEALTNVMLHSDAHAVAIDFALSDDVVTVTISDDGSAKVPALAAGGGNGIPGMAERARALGGTLVASSDRSTHGWTVHATVPLPTRSQQP